MSAEAMVVQGTVTKVHRGDLYDVTCELGGHAHNALVRRAGKLIVHRIRLVEGDTVVVELSGHDPKRGRVVFRGSMREAG